MRKLAIFDFDGTLFTEETIPFLLKQYGKLGYSKLKKVKVFTSLITLLIQYKLDKKMDKETFRAVATKRFLKVFEDMNEAQVMAFFKANIEVILNHLNPLLVDELARVRKEGYETILLSGCFTEILESLVEELDIDVYLGTELVYKENGKGINYEAEFTIVSGANKVTKLMAYLGSDEVDWTNSYAYGDSYYDLGILSLVGHPVAVCPDDLLLKEATSKDWTIIECI